MDIKKFVLVIISAVLVALFCSFLFFSKKEVSDISDIENSVEFSQEEPIVSTDSEDVAKEEIIKEKTVLDSTKSKTEEKSVVTPIQLEEIKFVKEAVVEKSIDPGVMKETETNEIVITREFKSPSPNKYTFEGYGVQKAPIR